jgi:hypothetical protein
MKTGAPRSGYGAWLVRVVMSTGEPWRYYAQRRFLGKREAVQMKPRQLDCEDFHFRPPSIDEMDSKSNASRNQG